MGLIVGDAVSCLRGSLDHLAYALTLVAGGTLNERANFPVIGVDNGSGRKSFNLAVNGITEHAVPIIKSLQPYHSGDAYKSTKLWQLHRLWNIDKHRRIPFHAQVTKTQIGCPADMLPFVGRSDDGSVMRFPLAAKDQLQFNPTVDTTIYFGDESEGISVTYADLDDMYKFVRNDVMPRFKSFF
jgi:hypothetical protein